MHLKTSLSLGIVVQPVCMPVVPKVGDHLGSIIYFIYILLLLLFPFFSSPPSSSPCPCWAALEPERRVYRHAKCGIKLESRQLEGKGKREQAARSQTKTMW